MDVAIFGTGNLATALGRAWTAAGHIVLIAGRDASRARAVADAIGGPARAVAPADLAAADALLVAVPLEGLADAMGLLGGPDGALAGKPVIDPTNPVDYATGRSRLAEGSAAETVAGLAPGAQVVKALHLFAGTSWPYEGPGEARPVVAIGGDAPEANATVSSLVSDLGGEAALVGGLADARQLEEAAGFVMRLVAAGHNPRRAVPDVDPV